MTEQDRFWQDNDPKSFRKMSNFPTLKLQKPLILLKIVLFAWFGAAAAMKSFIVLFLKQTGLSLGNISAIFTVLPFSQLLLVTASGIIADKHGRSKPVLQGITLLLLLTTGAMLFLPRLKPADCNKAEVHCYTEIINRTKVESYCDFYSNDSQRFNCNFLCQFIPQHQMKDICFQNYLLSCGNLSNVDASWPIVIPEYKKLGSECIEDYNNTNVTWCSGHIVSDCILTCKTDQKSSENGSLCSGHTLLIAVASISMITYRSLYAAVYRIIDVTTMSMAKTYSSDYGFQRFWAILGALVFSPLVGFLINVLSPKNGKQNYDIAFYFFEATLLFIIFVTWRLEVKLEPPAKDMIRKTRLLLRNPDVVVFFLIICVIGSAWGFLTVFSSLYLKELNAPSSLIGLVPGVNGLVGLPFLFTSKWFVTKIGTANLLILALLGYTAQCIGYSLLQNPWWCLPYQVCGVLYYYLLWVAVITHTHEVSPTGLRSTAISVAGGIHFGIGVGTGSLIGGVVMNTYGGRIAYRVMAGLCFGTAALYALYLFSRREFLKKLSDSRKTENENIADLEVDEKCPTQVIA